MKFNIELFFSPGQNPDNTPDKKDRYNSTGNIKDKIFIPWFQVKGHGNRIDNRKEDAQPGFGIQWFYLF